MSTETKTYANQGSCRRAAKAELGTDAVRGTDFEMAVDSDGRWMWWKLEAPRSSGDTLTREQWLRELTVRLHTEVFSDREFNEQFLVVPQDLPHYRVSCGFPGGGSARKRIGECWSGTSSKDGAVEMFISPFLDEPLRVADILAHEMIHMYLGSEVGHKAPFKRLMLAIGLEGKPTSTNGGPRFIEKVQPILDDMGSYPHAALVKGTGEKKQTTRLIKVECEDGACGAVFRITQKWIEYALAEGEGMCCPVCRGVVNIG